MELDEFHVANASPIPKSPHSGRNISQEGRGRGVPQKEELGSVGVLGTGFMRALLSFPTY